MRTINCEISVGGRGASGFARYASHSAHSAASRRSTSAQNTSYRSRRRAAECRSAYVNPSTPSGIEEVGVLIFRLLDPDYFTARSDVEPGDREPRVGVDPLG